MPPVSLVPNRPARSGYRDNAMMGTTVPDLFRIRIGRLSFTSERAGPCESGRGSGQAVDDQQTFGDGDGRDRIGCGPGLGPSELTLGDASARGPYASACSWPMVAWCLNDPSRLLRLGRIDPRPRPDRSRPFCDERRFGAASFGSLAKRGLRA